MCQSSSAHQKAGTGSPHRSLLVHVPGDPVCAEALAEAQSRLPASIVNHSFRVYLYALEARKLAPASLSLSAPAVDTSVLFVSCILHDIGASDTLALDPKRFEVTGADLAAALLCRHGFGQAAVREAWLAIAMHTSPHIAEAAGGLVRVVRLAVLADFASVSEELKTVLSEDYMMGIEELLPRLGVERELGDAVVSQSQATKSKAPGGSWPADLLRSAENNPDWDGINKVF